MIFAYRFSMNCIDVPEFGDIFACYRRNMSPEFFPRQWCSQDFRTGEALRLFRPKSLGKNIGVVASSALKFSVCVTRQCYAFNIVVVGIHYVVVGSDLAC